MVNVSETLLERVAAAEQRDPGSIRPVLQILVGEEPDNLLALRPVARSVNDQRLKQALTEFQSGSWTTEKVLREIPRFQTRQGVHALRTRGGIIGRTIGNAAWFPSWQFEGGDLRSDLGEILEALLKFSTDALASDRVMRLSREELHGRSIAESLNRPSEQLLAWKILRAVGDAD